MIHDIYSNLSQVLACYRLDNKQDREMETRSFSLWQQFADCCFIILLTHEKFMSLGEQKYSSSKSDYFMIWH